MNYSIMDTFIGQIENYSFLIVDRVNNTISKSLYCIRLTVHSGPVGAVSQPHRT